MFSVSLFQMNFQVCVPIGQKLPKNLVGWHGMNPPRMESLSGSRRCGLQQQCSTVGRDAQFRSIWIPLRSLGSTFWNPFVQLPKFQDFLTRSSEINLKDFSRCPTFSNRLGFLLKQNLCKASVTYGSLMCLECSGQHRSLGAGNLWGLVSRCFGHHTEIGELETRWSTCGAWVGGNFVSKKLVFLYYFFWLITLMLWRWHCTSVYKEVDVGLGWNSFNWAEKFLVGEIQSDERDDQSFLFGLRNASNSESLPLVPYSTVFVARCFRTQ